MALSATTIATAVSNLSVAGVAFKDLDEIPDEGLRAGLPAVIPDTTRWGGELAVYADEGGYGPVTFGTATTRFWMCERELGYLYLHAVLGSERSLQRYNAGMSDKRDLLVEALLELDVAGVDVVNINTGPFQVITDPAGNNYYGFTLSLRVREKVNA